MAPTGIAAQNINGNIIHSDLKIISTNNGFQTLAFHENELKEKLKKIDTIIIDEVSIVFAKLLDFISNIFATIYNNTTTFRGISIVLIGDLVQLPSVTGSPIFKSPT
jgi:ATP-dependent DNA helicase PIF1